MRPITRNGLILMLSIMMSGSYLVEGQDYLKPVNIWDKEIHANLFGGGRTLACPVPTTETVASWDFDDGKDNWPLSFTDPNVKNFRIENGIMKFTADSDRVCFGWGNYAWGEQKSMPPISVKGAHLSEASIDVRLRQSAIVASSNLKVDFRYHGDPLDAGTWVQDYSAASGQHVPERLIPTASGAMSNTVEWQVVKAPFRAVSEADGLGLEILTQKGNEIEIDWIKITKLNANIYARKEFTVPKDEVFSAKATTASSLSVYLNGKLVREGSHTVGTSRYDQVSIDLKPYLKSGKNILGVRELSSFISTPVCWLAGAVQMVSGETIKIGTDLDWKCCLYDVPGWLEESFDDSRWLAPAAVDPTGCLDQEMHPFTAYCPARLPNYCGQIGLENPDFAKFYYNDKKPARFVVRLPGGLATSPHRLSMLYGMIPPGRKYVQELRPVGQKKIMLLFIHKPWSCFKLHSFC